MHTRAAAQATNEADRLSILEDIKTTIGVDKLNNLIREALVDRCVGNVASQSQHHFILPITRL